MPAVGVRAAFLAALVAAALAVSWYREHSSRDIVQGRTARYAGTFLDARGNEDGFQTFTFLIDRGPLTLVSVSTPIAPGTRAIVRGRLTSLDGARNPGETSERVIETEHGISARIASARVITTLGPGGSWRARIARLRSHLHDLLARHLDEPDASIVAGELWGERAQLPPDLRQEFQETGTVHVLVTAGLHVGLVAFVVLWLCAWMSLPRAPACGIAILCVWSFAVLSGLGLPALRAVTMVTVALFARACGRSALSWQTLVLAAAVVIATIPGSIHSPSFWLSFCCVAAIFTLAQPLEALLQPLGLPHRVQDVLILTLATQLGTWPITAAMFEQWSSYALAANIAVVPCVPLTMLLGAAQLAVSWCDPIAQLVANLNSWILAWITGAVRLLAALPFASVVMTPAPATLIAAYEVALLCASWMARRGGLLPATALLATATSFVLWPPHAVRGDLRITVLDVGQADSIVIETPGRHAILVDAGGRLERGSAGNDSVAELVGERIVVPFLIRQGIHHLDALIVSHPHGDHVGGCAPVLRRLRVDEIADSGQTYGGHAYHDCLDTAAADHVPIVYPRVGDAWRTRDGVTLTFIGPSLPFIGGKNAINDNSVAFILQYRSFRMLFTGDAGVAAEQRFLSEGIDLHASVLKVGHHGSAYSSSPEFIAAVRPRYAIISVGRHNLFGHPAPLTIATLGRFGATIYRTDQNAATTVVTDGRTTTVDCITSHPKPTH
jgi:competence protein ComEC